MSKHIFRSYISRCAAEGVGPASVFQDLGKAEISQLDVAVDVDEDVFRLKIAVHDVIVMQVL